MTSSRVSESFRGGFPKGKSSFWRAVQIPERQSYHLSFWLMESWTTRSQALREGRRGRVRIQLRHDGIPGWDPASPEDSERSRASSQLARVLKMESFAGKIEISR